MSLYIILLTMLIAGIIGGIINCILPANADKETTKRIQPLLHCILIGVGATILVPLFLQIAQSNLLENIHSSWSLEPAVRTDTLKHTPSAAKSDSTVKALILKVNSAAARLKNDTLTKTVNNNPPERVNIQSTVPDTEPFSLKYYLIFGAYCFLAAAAGPRFINSLIDGVIKDQKIASLAKENKNVKEEKEKAVEEKEIAVVEKEEVSAAKEKVEKEKEKLAAQNQLAARNDEKAALQNMAFHINNIQPEITQATLLPQIGPVIHLDDPQKGRFGGLSENNGRILKASVSKAKIPDFYKVTVWVESTDPANPLVSDVIFYLHDSFRPSVYTIKTDEFVDGKAIDDEILAYGAFTVGAVTDNGATLLELDLALQPEFPKTFRNR